MSRPSRQPRRPTPEESTAPRGRGVALGDRGAVGPSASDARVDDTSAKEVSGDAKSIRGPRRASEETACRTCEGCIVGDHGAGVEVSACPACGELVLVDKRGLAPGVVAEPCPECGAVLEVVVDSMAVRVPTGVNGWGRPTSFIEATSRAAAAQWDPRLWRGQ